MARYADSDGYEKDRARPDAYVFRDWVINAYNTDMPFDRFTIEQLAGDLLPDATPSQKIATAFNRQTLTNEEGGVDPGGVSRQRGVRSHRHFGHRLARAHARLCKVATTKYDEIAQAEYYQMFAFLF